MIRNQRLIPVEEEKTDLKNEMFRISRKRAACKPPSNSVQLNQEEDQVSLHQVLEAQVREKTKNIIQNMFSNGNQLPCLYFQQDV